MNRGTSELDLSHKSRRKDYLRGKFKLPNAVTTLSTSRDASHLHTPASINHLSTSSGCNGTETLVLMPDIICFIHLYIFESFLKYPARISYPRFYALYMQKTCGAARFLLMLFFLGLLRGCLLSFKSCAEHALLKYIWVCGCRAGIEKHISFYVSSQQLTKLGLLVIAFYFDFFVIFH